MAYPLLAGAGDVPVHFAAGFAAPLALCLAAAPAMANTGAQDNPDGETTAMPALPPAEYDEKLAIGGKEIDARKLASRMTVEVRINETGPYKFVVDSGADTTVVGTRIAQALSLPPTTPRMLNTMTESRMVDRVTLDELQLGPTRFYDLEVPVLKEADLGAAGMIGLDALVEQRLMMDFEKRVITVDDASKPAPRYDGEIVVRARLQRGQLILTHVKANRISVDAVIDTGSEITIGNFALRDQLVRKNPKSLSTVLIAGVTGAEAELQIARVAEIKLGPVTLRNVTIAFADVPPFTIFGLSDQPALLLGTDLMENFRKVSLDFRARKVRFQLARCDTSRVRLRTSSSLVTRMSSDKASGCER